MTNRNFISCGDGFLRYMEYDDLTGAMIQTVDDVNHALVPEPWELPTGWETPAGGGLHLITNITVDN